MTPAEEYRLRYRVRFNCREGAPLVELDLRDPDFTAKFNACLFASFIEEAMK